MRTWMRSVEILLIDATIASTVALSLPSADDVPPGEPSVPADLLLLHGALEPEQFVADLDRGVVGKKGLVVERFAGGVLRGGEVDDHHRRRRLLQYRHPLPLDEVG